MKIIFITDKHAPISIVMSATFVILYLFESYKMCELIIDRLIQISEHFNQTMIFVSILPITFRIILLIVPLTFWIRTRELHTHWRNWMNFQVN